MATSILPIEVTNIGVNYNVQVEPIASVFPETIQYTPDFIALYTNATFDLIGNISINFADTPPMGTSIKIGVKLSTISLNGYTVSLFGYFLTESQLKSDNCIYEFTVVDENNIFVNESIPQTAQTLDGQVIIDDSLALTKLTGVADGKMIIGNGSDIATAVTPSGDVTISNAGVTAIGANKVTNTMLVGSIARTKILAGTANNVVINDGSGNLSSAAQLTPALGGTGIDNSSATGFLTYDSGAASVGVIKDTAHTICSFDVLKEYKIRMSFSGIITGVYACLVEEMGAGDGTLTLKNNAGTTMTDSDIIFVDSAPAGTAGTSTPTANNTFSEGDVITVYASGSDKGFATVSIDYTRTA